jgi:hypothetical protein
MGFFCSARSKRGLVSGRSQIDDSPPHQIAFSMTIAFRVAQETDNNESN